MALFDQHGRTMDYLRLAVTDKCNLRCRYCMPEEGIAFLQKKEVLSYDQFIRIGRIMSNLGVTKVRLTGGEPFVRNDLMDIIKEYSNLFRSINITTNATLIGRHIEALKKYKIGSINVSLDSLDANDFFRITKRDLFEKVWNSIENLISAGFRVKINVVIMKGINDKEIEPFLNLAKNNPVDVRFIEVMPFNDYDGNKNLFMPFGEILKTIQNYFPEVEEKQSIPRRSASVKFSIPGFIGDIGIIPAYSRSLCGSCNRIRVTAKGELLNCLYSTEGINIKQMFENKMSDSEITQAITKHVLVKEKNGFIEEEKRKNNPVFESMTTIGG